MARNRMLNPEFWLDEKLAKLSAHARLLYQGLWGICDDNYATIPDRPEWIKAQVFPYEKVDIRKLLNELSSSGHIVLFTFENEQFWFIKNFFKYQKVDKPSKPKYPKFEADLVSLDEESENTRTEDKISKDKISKVKTREDKALASKKDSFRRKSLEDITVEDLDEIAALYRAPRSFVDSKLDDLYNYCEKTGKTYKDYKAALRDWVKKDALSIRKEQHDKSKLVLINST